MRRFFEAILLLQFIASPTMAQNPYTAILRLGVMDTVTNPDEWAVRVYLDVFDAERNYIQVDDNINYYVDLCNGNGWSLQVEHANGALWDGMKIRRFPDCANELFQTFRLRAERVINGYTVSAETQLPDEETGSIVLKKPVPIYQIDYAGNPFGYVGLWVQQRWAMGQQYVLELPLERFNCSLPQLLSHF